MIKTTEVDVRIALERYPATRESDLSLIAAILYAKGYPKWSQTILDIKHAGIINFETCRRTRQKLQADHPELRPEKAVQDQRKESEEAYRQYALS